MMIRSQNGKVFTNDLNLFIEDSDGDFAVRNKGFYVGSYSSEEKAVKVMDHIEQWMEINSSLVIRKDEIDFCKKYVFRMPKDSEVEV